MWEGFVAVRPSCAREKEANRNQPNETREAYKWNEKQERRWAAVAGDMALDVQHAVN